MNRSALKKTLLCLLLVLVLLPGFGARALGGHYPEKEHLAVPYADMLPVTPFDETALLNAVEKLETLCGRNVPGGRKELLPRVQELYDQILRELDLLLTKSSLSGIQYYAGGGTDEDTALYLELDRQVTRLFDRCYRAFARLAVSPCRSVLAESAGEDAVSLCLGYMGMSEEEDALFQEEDRLTRAYDQIISSGVPAQAGGRVWTWEELDAAQVDEETYWTIFDALTAEQERAAGELYRRLLQVRNQIALECGYDNYADYAYEAVYNRDYSLFDAEILWSAVKESLLPFYLEFYQDLSRRLDPEDLDRLDALGRKSGEELLDDLQPFFQAFDPDLEEVFSFMRANHLYDIEYSEDKLYTGYTTALPAYGAAFIYLCPDQDYQDYGALVHEFGHFNQIYRSADHELWSSYNIDLSEVHAQALELMFTGYASELFGPDLGELYRDLCLYDLLSTILDGCLYDEFQAEAYRNPGMTLEELNRLYRRLAEDYGILYDSGGEEDPSWVYNAHTFRNPMYYISYATSALSSLDLWFLSLDRPEEAREIYRDLTTLPLPFREALETVGLRDIFDEDAVPALAEALRIHWSGGDSAAPPYDREASPKSAEVPPAGVLVMSCVAVAWIVFCTVILFRVGRTLSRRGGHGKDYRSAQPESKRPPGGRDPWDHPPEKPPWEE